MAARTRDADFSESRGEERKRNCPRKSGRSARNLAGIAIMRAATLAMRSVIARGTSPRRVIRALWKWTLSVEERGGIGGFVRASHARQVRNTRDASRLGGESDCWRGAPATSMSLGHGIVLSTTASDIISGTAASSGVDRSRPRTADRERHCVARACTRTRAP